MLIIAAALLALIVGARWLVGQALGLQPPLMPRNGALFRRGLVALAGPLSCLLALWILAFAVNLVGGLRMPSAPRVVSLNAGSPAERAGLLPGDHILAINGRPISSTFHFQNEIASTAGQPALLEIERRGAHQSLSVTAKPDGSNYRIGVRLDDTGFQRGLFAPSLGLAFRFPLHLSQQMLAALSAKDPSQKLLIELGGPVALRTLNAQQPSVGHTILFLVAPWLLLGGALSLVVSLILLAALRPVRRT